MLSITSYDVEAMFSITSSKIIMNDICNGFLAIIDPTGNLSLDVILNQGLCGYWEFTHSSVQISIAQSDVK